MAVTATQILSEPRGGGELYVVFIFTFTSGDVVRDGPRFLPSATDLNAYAATVAARVEAMHKDRELEDAVFVFPWSYTLRNVTPTELATYGRELYRNCTGERLARVAKRILEWITNGVFTELQVRNAFGLTLTQWNELKARIQILRDSWNVVDAATGE